jgi:hypothetical protein
MIGHLPQGVAWTIIDFQLALGEIKDIAAFDGFADTGDFVFFRFGPDYAAAEMLCQPRFFRLSAMARASGASMDMVVPVTVSWTSTP